MAQNKRNSLLTTGSPWGYAARQATHGYAKASAGRWPAIYSPDFPASTGSRSNCSGAAVFFRDDFNQFWNCSM